MSGPRLTLASLAEKARQARAAGVVLTRLRVPPAAYREFLANYYGHFMQAHRWVRVEVGSERDAIVVEPYPGTYETRSAPGAA